MPQICDMGQTALLPWGPKNPTTSAGSEPAILGTRGQHANHRSRQNGADLAFNKRENLRFFHLHLYTYFDNHV
jgi:hypothetical protein